LEECPLDLTSGNGNSAQDNKLEEVMVWANHFASGVHFLLHLAIAHIRFEVVKGKIQGEEQDFMPFLFGRVEQAIC